MSGEPASASVASAQIARRALFGAGALAVRQVVVQLLNLAGSVVLARRLSPTEFGYYGIATFLLAFLGSFGDVGLGASLIRQDHEPDEHDYRAVFTFQQLLVASLTLLFCLFVPWTARHFHIGGSERAMLFAVAASFFVTSFRSVPAIRLERKLAFDRLAIADIAQTVAFNVVAVGLAITGHGVYSFALAILVRSLVGALIIQLVSRWRLAWAIDWPLVKTHMEFGLPFQAIGLVSLIKDSITPVLIGSLVSAAAVGYINWAMTAAGYPVMLLMMFGRVYLPAFARLQSDREALGRFVEQIVWATNAIVAPLAIIMLALFEPFTRLVFGAQWLVAKPYFMLIWISNLFVPTATPLLGLVNALGRPRTGLLFAVIWMLGTWLIGAPLIVLYGAIGFVIANVCVQFTNLALYRVAQSLVPFRILLPTLPAWSIAAVVGAALWALNHWLPVTQLAGLIGYALLGLGSYVLGVVTLDAGAVRKMRGFLGKPA